MAWVETRGTKFRGAYRDANDHPRYTPLVTSKRKALAAANEKESELRRGEWIDDNLGKMTFAVYFEEHWLPFRIGELNTLKTYYIRPVDALQVTSSRDLGL